MMNPAWSGRLPSCAVSADVYHPRPHPVGAVLGKAGKDGHARLEPSISGAKGLGPTEQSVKAFVGGFVDFVRLRPGQEALEVPFAAKAPGQAL